MQLRAGKRSPGTSSSTLSSCQSNGQGWHCFSARFGHKGQSPEWPAQSPDSQQGRGGGHRETNFPGLTWSLRTNPQHFIKLLIHIQRPGNVSEYSEWAGIIRTSRFQVGVYEAETPGLSLPWQRSLASLSSHLGLLSRCLLGRSTEQVVVTRYLGSASWVWL